MERHQLNNHIEEIKKLYCEDGLSSIKIGNIYGVSHTAILDLLIRFGVNRKNIGFYSRKYDYDINYFETIDSKDKAYFLGLIMADGCAHEQPKSFNIKLQEKDGYILETFNKYLKSNKPIHFLKSKVETHQNMRDLGFKNDKMYDDLNKLGVIPRKSLILEFPNISQVAENLLTHFIRGYFDGDGCITMPSGDPTRTNINICLSKTFGEKLKVILNNIGIKPCLFEQNSIYHLAFGGRLNSLKFLNWIYQDIDDLYLIRKYEKYLVAKNYNPKSGKGFSSEYFGVYFSTKKQRFAARISHEGKEISIGYGFKNEKDAAIAYDIKAKEYFGELATLNFDYIDEADLERITTLLRTRKWSENGKFRGVYFIEKTGNYCAKVYFNGKTLNVGRFQTELGAAIAHDNKAVELLGTKAKTNFPIENYQEILNQKK